MYVQERERNKGRARGGRAEAAPLEEGTVSIYFRGRRWRVAAAPSRGCGRRRGANPNACNTSRNYKQGFDTTPVSVVCMYFCPYINVLVKAWSKSLSLGGMESSKFYLHAETE